MIELTLLNGMTKVFPDKVCGFEWEQGSMLQNENYHFCFSVFRNEDTPLIGKIKIKSGIPHAVRCFRTQLVPAVMVNGSRKDDYVLRGASGLFPDPLVSCDGYEVFPARSYVGYAVEIYEKEGLAAGEYPITVCVCDREDNLLCEKTFSLKVIGAMLPKNNLIITQWIHFDSIAEMHSVSPFTDEYYAVLKNYFDMAVRYGQNTVLTPLFTFALDTDVGKERQTFQLVKIKKQGTNYEFDFSALKKFIDFAFSCGFTYLELSHLFTQWGAKACPKIMAEENGKEVRIFGWENASSGEEYTHFLSCFLPALSRFLDGEGIKERCFMHLSDEPREEAVPLYRTLSQTVKKYLTGVKVMDALSDYAFYGEGLVDMPAVATTRAQPFLESKTPCLAYYCGAQCFDYASNRFLDMPLQRTRVLGFQLYETGAKGFLHWGFNFYRSVLSLFPVDPYRNTDAGGYYPAGDAFIVYPEKNGCIPSIRLLSFYDGIQDYLVLTLLEEKYGREYMEKILRKEGVSGYLEYPHDAAWHASFRERLNDMITYKN